MVQKTAITEAITTLAEAESRFNLRRTEDEQFFPEWVVVLESKRTTISDFTALPQTLAYMMTNPDRDKPVFGMVTNGDEIFFVKLSQQGTPEYDIAILTCMYHTGRGTIPKPLQKLCSTQLRTAIYRMYLHCYLHATNSTTSCKYLSELVK